MSFACGFEPPSVGASVDAPCELARPVDDRAAIEQFIGDVFIRRFGARVPGFMPELVASRDEGGRIVAAAGIRSAREPLFLEQYLDAPIERCIERLTGERPRRAAIVEVGQLAAVRSGEGRRLILSLARQLGAWQVEWVVGTLTQELRHLLERMGVEPLVLQSADPARLGASASDWGRYYEHAPKVLAGHLPSALARLQRVIARSGQ